MSRRPTPSWIAIAACSVAVAGCGVDTDDAGQANTSPTVATTTTGAATTGPTGVSAAQRQRQLEARLPKRPSGTVAIDGRTQDSITRQGAVAFRGQGGNARLAFTGSTEDRAFQNLCAGRVDAIEVTTLPSQGIIDLCRSRGIELVSPIQLASDAIVLATKNESDVGGDCITVQQANEIYRSGSPIDNWSQLGFDDLPLRATGREADSDVFQFFGQLVLNRVDASLSDVRGDYIVHRSDPRERREVTNAARLENVNKRVGRYRARLVQRTITTRRRYVSRAERAADRRVLAEIRRVNERNRKLKITVDGDALERRNRRLVETAKRQARARANAAYDARLNLQVRRYRNQQLEIADAPGTVGAFRFSYYELFEEQLRPLEVDFGVPETETGQPVRVGDLTDEDQDRVNGRTRPTTTTPTSTTSTTTTTTPTTTTTTPTRTVDPETPIPTTGTLPKTDRNGKTIYRGPGCVFPAQTTITSGVYPLTQRFFVITSQVALRRREVRAFLDYLVTNSRTLATDNRLVPITDQQLSDELTTIRGRRPSEQEVTGTEVDQTAADDEQQTTTGQAQTVAPTTTTAAPTSPPPAGTDTGIPGVSARPAG